MLFKIKSVEVLSLGGKILFLFIKFYCNLLRIVIRGFCGSCGEDIFLFVKFDIGERFVVFYV